MGVFCALLLLLSDDVLRLPSRSGWSPLLLAVRRGNVEMVRMLLARGVSPNTETGYLAPLQIACSVTSTLLSSSTAAC